MIERRAKLQTVHAARRFYNYSSGAGGVPTDSYYIPDDSIYFGPMIRAAATTGMICGKISASKQGTYVADDGFIGKFVLPG